jgi:nuclease-like protein
MQSKESRSPLKDKPLRLPGQSVQDALDKLIFDKFIPYVLFVIFLAVLTAMEWLAVVRHAPRQPWLYTGMTVVAAVVCGWQFVRIRQRATELRLGRDGERAVGQFLEDLREDGARVYHDVPGDKFNLDHVVLSPKGFFVIETKTHTKPPRGEARVPLTADSILVGGFKPDRDPVNQVQAGVRWLSQLLEESTGKRFRVRGAVVFPGWWVEPMTEAWKRADLPWVLEPKALPAFIANEPKRFDDTDVRLAAFHLSRYIRAE